MIKCAKCFQLRKREHYRARDNGVCVFCKNTLTPDELLAKNKTSSKSLSKKKRNERATRERVVIVEKIVYTEKKVHKKNKSTRIRKIYESAEHREYMYYVSSAIARGLSFEIDQETFYRLKSENCFYCGGVGGGIDRVDNSKGYVYGNCAPCCSVCNKMKLTMGVFSFIDHCRKIVKNME